MRILGLVATMLVAGPVAAECPVAADLEAGIRFDVDEGDSEVFRSLRPGVVEAIYSHADGGATRTLLGQGVYLLELVEMAGKEPDPSTRMTYAFPQNAEDLPRPVPGSTAQFELLRNENGSLEREVQSYDFGPQARATFGACTYDMIPIEIRYSEDDSNTVDLLHYLPELGIAYFAGSTYDGTTDRYSYHRIEAVK